MIFFLKVFLFVGNKDEIFANTKRVLYFLPTLHAISFRFMQIMKKIFLFTFALFWQLDLSLAQSDLPFFQRNVSIQNLDAFEYTTLEDKIGQLVAVTWEESFSNQEKEELFQQVLANKVGTVLIKEGEIAKLAKKISALRALKTKVPLLIGLQTPFFKQHAQSGFLLPSPRSLAANKDTKKAFALYQNRIQLLGEMGVDFITLDGSLDEQINKQKNGQDLFGSNALRAGQLISELVRIIESEGLMVLLQGFPGEGFAEQLKQYQFPVNNRNLTELKIMDWVPFQMARLRGLSMIQTSAISLPAITGDYSASGLSKKLVKDQLQKDFGFKGLIMSPPLNSSLLRNDFGNALNVLQAFEAGNDLLCNPVDPIQDVKLIAEKVSTNPTLIEQLNHTFSKVLLAKMYAAKRKGNNKKLSIDLNLQAFYAFNHYEKSTTLLTGKENIPIDASQPLAVVNCGKSIGVFQERISSYSRNKVYQVSKKDNFQTLMESIPKEQVVLLNIYPDFFLDMNYAQFQKLMAQRKVYLNVFEDLTSLAVLEQFPFQAVLVSYDHNSLTEDLAAQQLMGGVKIQGVFPTDIGIKWKQGTQNRSAQPSRLKFTFPEELGLSREKLEEIDVIVKKGIIQKAYPGCQVMVAKDGKVFYHQSFGHQTYAQDKPVNAATIYDLASITKTAASTNAIMKLVEQGKLDLNATLGQYLPDLVRNTPYAHLKLREILAHQAGLSPWIPFYTKTLINKQPDPEIYANSSTENKNTKVASNLFILDSYRDVMLQRIIATPLKPKGNYKYSDLGYYLLQKIIEQQSNVTLDKFLEDEFYRLMGLPTLGYNPLAYYAIENIAPTERDNYFRHQLVHGYVHDMGAAMIGGVAGHAGLFSNATDLMVLMQMLLNDGYYGGKQFLKPETIKSFTSCQYCPRNRRGAGFDKPVLSLEGGPTAKLVSLESFGHTGFTGTQAWADPVHGINYVFLSNRVYPNAENRKLISMGIRTEIQRVIYEAVNSVGQVD